MMQIKWDTAAFKKSMKAARTRLSTLVMKAVGRTAELAAAHARVNTLFKTRSGELRSSIKDSRTGPFSAKVTASARHARFVEEGTRAHEIRPKRTGSVSSRGVSQRKGLGSRKWLRFEQDGAIRFARVVKHPGTKPRPFMQQARDKVVPLFERLCSEAVNRMFG